MQADGKGVEMLAKALATLSGYKAPPSKRSLLTGEDELRTLQLVPSGESEGGQGLQVRDVMRIVSLALEQAGDLDQSDKRIGKIAQGKDGTAVIDLSPKAAVFLAEELKGYEESNFFAGGAFVLPEVLPDLIEERRREFGGGGGSGRGGGGGGWR